MKYLLRIFLIGLFVCIFQLSFSYSETNAQNFYKNNYRDFITKIENNNTNFINSEKINIGWSINNFLILAITEKNRKEKIRDIWNLLLMQGGILIYPLVVLSFLTLVLILFYFLSIRKGLVVSKKYMRISEEMIRKNDFLGLISFSSNKNLIVAKICHKAIDFALKNPRANYKEVKEVTEAEGSRQVSMLTNRVSYLADIGAIAPMVGLLGTVVGMIKAFGELSRTVGVLQAELSGGVAEALITTASGLIIGITALIFYSLFRGRVQKLITEMETASTHLLALISTQFEKDNDNQENKEN